MAFLFARGLEATELVAWPAWRRRDAASILSSGICYLGVWIDRYTRE